MRRTRISLLVALALSVIGAPARAQMDMLPQIFRDLPPELQQGLPEDMTYDEYRRLTRNVDFFTMFMSMWAPGYGLFQVERPKLAWGIVGVRTLGYGMMGAAMYRQWNDMRDLARLSKISDVRFQSFLANVFLFGGGIVLNGMGWAADVLGAYHIAQQEKDYVIYKYGVQAPMASAESEERRIGYIRKLVLQDDRYVKDDLLSELKRYLADYRRGAHRAEVEFYLGTLYGELYEPERALLHLSRVLLFYPGSRFAENARRAAIGLAYDHRDQWAPDWERLMTILHRGAGGTQRQDEPQDEPPTDGELFSRYLSEFARFRTAEFQALFVEEALSFSVRYKDDPYADDALWAAAQQLRRSGRFQDAAITLTELAFRFPDSEHAAEALYAVGELLSAELDAGSYAAPFYDRVVELFPRSEPAARVRTERAPAE